MSLYRPLLAASTLALPALLSGCDLLVLNPPGMIAAKQAQLIMTATVLMLLIIIPVLLATFYFAWRYKANRSTDADYKPDWDHSTQLELMIWLAPMLIIVTLGAITWINTHLLDPYRPLTHISKDVPVPAGVEPLEVQVVAMDWKWLFFYPEQGIATVNEMAAPIDRPIRFRITSSNVMNAFYIPAMAGMIYAMPGMETTLHGVIGTPGVYDGFSSQFSGAGFSHMRFRFHALDQAGFDAWIDQARASGASLDRDGYLALEKPSREVPVQRFAHVDPALFDAAVNRCVDTRHMCVHEMMQIDAAGGSHPGQSFRVVERTRGDLRGGPFVESAMCLSDGTKVPLSALALATPDAGHRSALQVATP